MRTATRLSMVALAAAVLLHAGRAWAPFHLMAVDQVFFGTEDCPGAQYVMLRLLAPGMQFVNNQPIETQNADGSPAADFGSFTANATNGAADANIIMGTADAAGLFGIEMDEEVSGVLIFPDGRVCFGDGPVDCVAYGNFTGDNGPNNMPAVAPVLGQALVRQGNTSNDQVDFALGAPAPRNNAGDVGTLGVCPGGVETPTATGGAETPTPTPTGVPTGTTAGCVGDCDDDDEVEINELILGVNISLGLQPLDACQAFNCMGTGTVPISCLIQGVNNSLNGCPEVPTVTPTPGAGPVGVRRFSLDPAASQFVAVIGPGAGFPFSGFQGFLELTANDSGGSLVSVDVTDASDYLSIDLPAGGTAVCLKILKDQLPVRNAGLLSCNGGLPLGIQVRQDHNVGVVGECVDGANAGQDCTGDPDCPDSTCFTAEACAEAGGTVEGPSDLHPGVCNGSFVGSQDTEVSPPGTLILAPDPNGIIAGIPIELSQELSTPCGDEGVVGMPVRIGFTTGRAFSQITDYNNDAGEVLDSPVLNGTPFSCEHWQQEDGPGTLVLSATQLDTQITPGSFVDIAAQFILVD